MTRRHTLCPLSLSFGAFVLVAVTAAAVCAQAPVNSPDAAMYARIRAEGMEHSRVMDYATQLIDGIGPRLTGSPNLEKAVAWAMDRLGGAGASNVQKESWGEFGMGWRQRNVWARLVEPYPADFVATAAPWSPATPGPITAEVISVSGFTDDSGFAPLRGKLRGKIVLLGRSA